MQKHPYCLKQFVYRLIITTPPSPACPPPARTYKLLWQLLPLPHCLPHWVRTRSSMSRTTQSLPTPPARQQKTSRVRTSSSCDQTYAHLPYYADRISSIRRPGYYFFAVHFSVATTRGWLLFESGVYFIGKPKGNKVHEGNIARHDRCWFVRCIYYRGLLFEGSIYLLEARMCSYYSRVASNR